MIPDASAASTPSPRPPLPPRVGFDVHVLQDTHHADEAGLHTIAETAYELAGFRRALTAAELAQARAANPAQVIGEPGVRDMRTMTWSAIDNPTSKDPDQVSCAERLPDGSIRIYVAAADVDGLVPKASPLDQRALDNMTTVYTDLEDFSMLPDSMSQDRTVLVSGQDRPALVTEFVVTPNGEVKDKKTYRAVVNNHCQLSYPAVDQWFADSSQEPAAMHGVAGMPEQLYLQDEAAAWLEAAENAAGRPPVHPAAGDHAAVVDGRPVDSQRAQRLVEMQMRTVNRIAAEFLLSNGSPALVRARHVTPDGWVRLGDLAKGLGVTLPDTPDNAALQGFLDGQKADKEHFPDLQKQVSNLLGPPRYMVALPGHEAELFTLGSPLSARTTGPNRLMQDLVNQRLIKAVLAAQPCPYAIGDPAAGATSVSAQDVTLSQVADRANHIERRTIDVMRQVQNSMAAFSMQEQIHRVFASKVSGHNNAGSFVALPGTHGDGFVHAALEKGQEVTVRVDSVDIEKGRVGLSLVETPSPLVGDPPS